MAYTNIERNWGLNLAQRLIGGESTIKIDRELRGFNLTRIDIVRFVLMVGKFSIEGDSERDLQGEQQKRTAQVLERLLLDRLFGLSTLNYLWDNVGHYTHREWKVALCTHLTSKGLYALLMNEPSDAFKPANSAMLPLTGKIIPHVPVEKQTDIISLAKKRRKIAYLYELSGWQGCRELAKGSELEVMIGSDLGI